LRLVGAALDLLAAAIDAGLSAGDPQLEQGMSLAASAGISHYRWFLLAADNSVVRTRELWCVDDDEARQRAMFCFAMADEDLGVGFELWHRERRLMSHFHGPEAVLQAPLPAIPANEGHSGRGRRIS
jgi:hypothetical protein